MTTATPAAAADIRSLIQKLWVLVLGIPADTALAPSLAASVIETGSWERVIVEANGYLSNQAQLRGAAALVQQMAQQGLGLALSADQAAAIAQPVTAGLVTWADLLANVVTGLQGPLAQTLSNRAEAATLFTEALVAQQKGALYSGSYLHGAASNLLTAISTDPATLQAAKTSLALLVDHLGADGVGGVVSDGRIANATVFVDGNRNGVMDPGEFAGRTDAEGDFRARANLPEGPLLTVGGTDTLTGLPTPAAMQAPAGATAVTPFTSLMLALMNSGAAADVLAASALVTGALGLPAINLLNQDPLAVLNDPDASPEALAQALAFERVAVQLMNAAGHTVAALVAATGVSVERASQLFWEAAAHRLGATGAPLDLTDAASIAALMADAVTSHLGSAPSAQVQQVIEGLSLVTAAVNQQAGQAATIQELAKVAVVGQGVIPQELPDSLDTPDGLQDYVDLFTGDSLGGLIDAAQPGPGTPPEPAVPMVSTSGSPVRYIENGDPLRLDPMLVVSDRDDALLRGATVSIVGGLQAGDSLSFTPSGAITGHYDAASGTLTLTGLASLADYQATLRSVQFHSTQDAPAPVKTIHWQVSDRGAHPSPSATTVVQVTAVNDAPVAGTPSLGTVDEDTSRLITQAQLLSGVTDPDSHRFTATGLTITSGNGSLTDNGDGTWTYRPAANDDTEVSFSFIVSDGAQTATGTATLDIAAINDAPVSRPVTLAPVVEDNTRLITQAELLANAFDIDGGGSLTVSAVAITSGSGSLVDNGNGTWTYTPVANDDTSVSFSYTVSDGDQATSGSATLDITPVNDTPVITVGTAPAYTENDPATVIAPTATVSDIDSPDFNGGSLSVTFTANGTAADQLAVPHQGNAAGQIGVAGSVVSFGGIPIGTIDAIQNGVNGTPLLITFNSAAATPAAVQALARAVTFANTSELPSEAARTLSFVVNDGDGSTGTASTTVNVTSVNDRPQITGAAATPLAYTENDAATTVNGGLILGDVDSVNLTGATVSISANYVNGEDRLAFTGVGAITGSFDAATGLLTLSGTDTLANYQAALRSVTYFNTSDNPGAATRTLSFLVNDGQSANNLSNIVQRDVTVAPVNDKPVFTVGTTLAYTENEAPKLIAPAATVSDPDSPNFDGGWLAVGLTANGQGTDQLTVIHQGTGTGQIGVAGSDIRFEGVTIGTVDATDNGANGVQLLIRLNSAATPDAVQTLTRAIAFSSTSENPSTAERTLTFTVVDGDGGADTTLATAKVNVTSVNDAPVVTVANAALAYTENAGAVAVDSGLTLADADSTMLSGASVRITSGYVNGEDLLAFTPVGAITGSFDATTGVFTLTGLDSPANYQIALRSVTYTNTRENPGATPRTLSFQVEDSAGALSSVVGRDINVTPVNDAPVLTVGTTLEYTANDAPTRIAPAGTLVDVDSPDFAGGSLTVGFSVNGQAEDQLAIAAVGQISVAAGKVLHGALEIGSVSGGVNGANLVISFNGNATEAAVQALLQAITYANSASMPVMQTRTVLFTLVDGDGTASGGVDTGSATATINVAPATNPFTTITEDQVANAGQTVFSLFPNTGTLNGIAIHALNSGNGSWQYSIDGGTSWNAVGAVSDTSALLLRTNDLLRFVPDAKNGTTGALDFYAWNPAMGAAGTQVDASVRGPGTAFSSGSASSAITVTDVNDAPEALGGWHFVSITEDDVANAGQMISSLMSSSDVDTGAEKGVFILEQTSSRGTWQYSLDGGTTWSDLGPVALSNALLLRATDHVRFVPDGKNSDSGSIFLGVWDQTSGTVGTKVNVTVLGGTSAFSTTGVRPSISTVAVNDAPVLVSTADFAAITEDDTNNAGQLVSTLLTSSDVDTGAAAGGVAVHAQSASNGSWQYSIDGGTSWNALGAVADASALLLRATDKLRFVPNGQNAGSGSIDFYVWDQSTGTAGTLANASTRGGTTAFSTGSGTSSISATAANDAPVLQSATDFASITEDDTGTPGQLVSSLFASSDADTGATAGIAIHALTGANGIWQYSTNDGVSWTNAGAVSDTSALLLRSTDKLRFVPDGRNGDTPAVSFYAWDQSTGVAGATADASTRGGTTAYSQTGLSVNLSVTAVNDAPVLTGSMSLTGISEDAIANVGNQVASLMGVTDVDAGALGGMAIYSQTPSNGTWQYSTNGGLSWTDVGSVSLNGALLLRGTDHLRFVPDQLNGDLASFNFVAWDQTSGTAGTKVDVNVRGGTTAFSTLTRSSQITVNAVNDAPAITAATDFASITEDDTSTPGQLVSSLFASSDVDTGATAGIAIHALTGANGTWQYSTDDGVSWTNAGAVSDTSALLLRSTDKLRFVPDGRNGDTPAVSFYAWDQSTGVAGATADASTRGGTTAYSQTGLSANLSVTAVNDAPVLTVAANLATITEDAIANVGNQVASLIGVSDVDAGALAGMAIYSQTPSNGTWQYSTDAGTTWTDVGSVSLNGALLLRGTDHLRFVPDQLNGDLASFNFVAWDQTSGTAGTKVDVNVRGGTTAFSTLTRSSQITVNAVNDAPVIAGSIAGPLTYTENAPATVINGALTLTDVDGTTLTGATVEISSGFAGGEDVLGFTPLGGISGIYDPATGKLTFTGTSSLANYETVLRSVTYRNTSENPGTAPRTISFQVNDGAGVSAAVTRTVALTPLNDGPSITGGATLSYTENGAAAPIAPLVDISDVDSGDFNGGSLTVAIAVNGTAADQLAVRHEGTGIGQIGVAGSVVSYGGAPIGTMDGVSNGVNGVQLLITLNSSATPAAMQALARNVTFANTSDNPSTLPRTISFTVNDGDGASASAAATVTVTPVNDAPTVATTGGAAAFSEGGSAVAIDPTLTLTDVDSPTLASATVQITGGHLPGSDALTFTNLPGMGNIAASFDPVTGSLTLTSAGASATLAEWQAALRSVTFESTSGSPGPARTISFQVNDGAASSNLATRDIAITETNSRPVVTLTAGSAAFVENAAAVAVDAGIALADPDTATLTGATVSITTGFQAGEDVLSFTPASGITGSYVGGVLTLSGTATVAQYQSVLASVKYNNTSDTPNTASRAIAFQVNDGQSVDNLSTLVTRNVTVTATNDAPNLNLGTLTGYVENASPVAIAPTATVGDDSPNFDGGSLRIEFTANGTPFDQLSVPNGVIAAGQISVGGGYYWYGSTVIGVDTYSGLNGAPLVIPLLTDATPAAVQALVRAISFHNTSDAPLTAPRTLQFTLKDGDGGSDTAVAAAPLNVTAVNDAPVVTGSIATPLPYTENAPAAAIDSGLTLSDVDGGTLTGATVKITSGFAAGQDVLGFTKAGAVTGSFNAATGELTLSGSDSLANYQAVLRSVTYFNTSDNPSAASRTISFQVDDGQAVTPLSNVVTRDVTVTPVNDAPAISAGGPLAYTENDGAKVVSSGLTLSDAEGNPLTGATVKITSNYVNGQDTLTYSGPLSSTFDAGTGTLTLSGSGTAAEYQAALRSVTYTNGSEAPSTLDRTISFQATDSDGAIGSASTTVKVAAVNDAPVTTVPATASVGTAFSNTPLSIAGVSIADVDAGNGLMTVQLSATSGNLTVTLNGTSVAAGALGSHSVTLSGTATQLNAALATLSYKSDDGFTGADTVTVKTDDGGNTGGSALNHTGTFQVGVVPQVFLIDNNNVVADDATAGTAANPFNSIASFNASPADGEGDYIYLRQGKGTYSETNGLTLLKGQQVWGEGQTLTFTNPVTSEVVSIGSGTSSPTLSITGASQVGVKLAQDNTLKGFNVATTASNQTGIADNNGTVGNLSISAMDVTGSGMAVDIDQGGALTVAFNKLTSSGSSQQGVQLAGTTLSGSFSASSTSSISGSTGAAFQVGDGAGGAGTGGTVAISYAGSLSANLGSRTVDIQDRAAGAGDISFSGAVNHTGSGGTGVYLDQVAGNITLSGTLDLTTGTSNAIQVSNSSGSVLFSGAQSITTTSGAGVSLTGNSATVTFSGSGTGLDITSGTGAGFSASANTGAVKVLGTDNTLSSTGGAALSVVSSPIDAAGLTFKSISANGGASGIVLNDTGSTSGVTVTGSGTAGSGGTIQNTTSDGISVTKGVVNLNWMTIQNTSGHGINAKNLLGTSSLNNSAVSGFDTGNTKTKDGLHIVNDSTNALTSMTVNKTTFSTGAKGNDGIFMEAQGTGNMALVVTGSTFTDLFGDGIQVNSITGAGSTVKLTVNGSTFSNAVNNPPALGNGGIALGLMGNVNVFADINGNTLSGILKSVSTLGAINVTNGPSANSDITIRNNIITDIVGGRGISVTADGGTADLLIDNNTINRLGSTSKPAIHVNFIRYAAAGPTASGDVTVRNNHIGEAGPLWSANVSANAVLLQALDGASMDAHVINNIIANANTSLEAVRVRAASTATYTPPFGSTMTATVEGNTMQNAAGGRAFDASVGNNNSDNSTLTLNYQPTNTLTGGIRFNETTGADLRVVQGGAPGGATVVGTPTYGVSPPVLPLLPLTPLVAARESGPGAESLLTNAQLVGAVAAAAQRWDPLLTDTQREVLANTAFALADLDGNVLGAATPGLVLIDRDAGGWGWYIDATPNDDAEFHALSSTLLVSPEVEASGQLDLLTAVLHEIGHILGFDDHLDAAAVQGVMYGYLHAGERRLPDTPDLEITGVPVPDAL